MFHDSPLFLDQPPAAPAPPASRIRRPHRIPLPDWDRPDAIAEELRLFADAKPQGNKTLH